MPHKTNFTYRLLTRFIFLFLFGSFSQSQAQNTTQTHEDQAFQEGEWFKFRIHYGAVTAGYATLEVTQDANKAEGYHIKGFGETVGLPRLFFKVEDYYESYIDKESNLPYKFTRKINEGGYTKNKIIEFDQTNQRAVVNNIKKDTTITFDTDPMVHDMVSSFYYLRNFLDVKNLKKGEETSLTMFFDEENYRFKLRYLGQDTIRTKFGKVPCLMFRPLVLAGRVFKEQESLTIWVSNDGNKIPMRIKASLAVGSIKADITEFKGLKNQLKVVEK